MKFCIKKMKTLVKTIKLNLKANLKKFQLLRNLLTSTFLIKVGRKMTRHIESRVSFAIKKSSRE